MFKALGGTGKLPMTVLLLATYRATGLLPNNYAGRSEASLGEYLQEWQVRTTKSPLRFVLLKMSLTAIIVRRETVVLARSFLSLS
ncbi:MAG TPA: hypothetical protein DD979_05005 [Gammaproteobacteria bacterium]|nr:hypothetical protein [Gammaproteobacteria bacterium]